MQQTLSFLYQTGNALTPGGFFPNGELAIQTAKHGFIDYINKQNFSNKVLLKSYRSINMLLLLVHLMCCLFHLCCLNYHAKVSVRMSCCSPKAFTAGINGIFSPASLASLGK